MVTNCTAPCRYDISSTGCEHQVSDANIGYADVRIDDTRCSHPGAFWALVGFKPAALYTPSRPRSYSRWSSGKMLYIGAKPGLGSVRTTVTWRANRKRTLLRMRRIAMYKVQLLHENFQGHVT